MTPTEYEHHVADILRSEGWKVEVTPPQRDLGVDVLGDRNGERLAVQVKMYGSRRSVNRETVSQLVGDAKLRDCTRMMLVTDGRVLPEARVAAEKLAVEIRYIPAIPYTRGDGDTTSYRSYGSTFDGVWADHIMPLAGQELRCRNGGINKVVSVDWGGLTRITSNNRRQRIDIEIFRWTIERLLGGNEVLREEINDRYQKRASSGIVRILGAVDMFELIRVDGKMGLRHIGLK